MALPRLRLAALLLLAACAAKQTAADRPLPKPNIDPGRVPPPGKEPIATAPEPEDTLRPMVPPEAAYAHGWMPLASTGVDQFLRAHPAYDGRNVLIGILDTGIDPGIPGLQKTSTNEPKILDLRDFSDEGAVSLQPVTPAGDSVEIAGHRLGGFGRVAALNAGGPYYGGVIREIPLGEPPASDLNGNGRATDTLVVLVTRATDGWIVLADTDGNGSLAGERPVHDYLVAREWFGWAARGRAPRVNLAANFSVADGRPRLNLVFDTFSHGSHVAGIAGAHDLYGVPGFDGVAPGAQLLGLKIANSAQGSITTSGSMLRAIDYAIRFANARQLPLILNLSFGVGNGPDRCADRFRPCRQPDSSVHHQRGERWTRSLEPGVSRLRFTRHRRGSDAAGELPGSRAGRKPGRSAGLLQRARRGSGQARRGCSGGGLLERASLEHRP
jgi:subtilisin family serine protease